MRAQYWHGQAGQPDLRSQSDLLLVLEVCVQEALSASSQGSWSKCELTPNVSIHHYSRPPL